jgi:hypothetical protein
MTSDPDLDSMVHEVTRYRSTLNDLELLVRTRMLETVRAALHGRWLGSYSGNGATVVTTLPGATGCGHNAERVRLTYYAGLGWKAALGFARESEGFATGPAAAMVSLAGKAEDYSTEVQQQILARVKGAANAQG